MASCAQCGSTIMFGGRKHGEIRFCSAKCEKDGAHLISTIEIPEKVIAYEASRIWKGNCPICDGEGPTDIHTAHSVWSAIVITRWVSLPQVSCKSCGRKQMYVGILKSTLLGWWGFPWGIFITPAQIIRNIFGIVAPPDPSKPSKELLKFARFQLANRIEQQKFAEKK